MSVPLTRAQPRAALPLAALTAASALLLALVAAGWGPLTSSDRWVADGLHRSALAHPGFTQANRVLTDWFWDPWTMRLLVFAAVLWTALRRAWPLALWLLATSWAGTLAQQGLKAAVDRDRPHWAHPVDSAHYAAFPSGHAMTATVSCGLLLWLLRLYGAGPVPLRAAGAVAAVSVLGVGFTRIYLGVHWLSDVVGGWLLGALLVAASAAAYRRIAGGP